MEKCPNQLAYLLPNTSNKWGLNTQGFFRSGAAAGSLGLVDWLVHVALNIACILLLRVHQGLSNGLLGRAHETARHRLQASCPIPKTPLVQLGFEPDPHRRPMQ